MSANMKAIAARRKGYLLFPLLIFFIGFLVPVASVQNAAAQEPLGWYEQVSGTEATLAAVGAADALKAWAVGAEGTILKTEDGGGSWLPQDSETALHLADISVVDENVAWAVGGDGVLDGAYIVLRTVNGGQEWETVAQGTGFSLWRIAAVNDQTAWVAGANGVISKTADGGSGWTIQPTGTTHPIMDIEAVDADHLWAVGGSGDFAGYIQEGVILKTENGGGSWSVRKDERTLYRSISAADVNTAWVAGSYNFFNGFPPMTYGILMKTADAGTTWALSGFYGMSLFGADVEAVNASTAWLIGQGGYGYGGIAKTENGGASWAVPQTDILPFDISSISAANSDSAWIVGGNRIFHTSNGGWSTPAPQITSISPQSCGLYSTVPIQITITGSGFGSSKGTSAVAFGEGTVLQEDSWSDSEIVFSLNIYDPSQWPAGEYPVSVTTPTGGTSNVAYFSIVDDIPAPSIALVLPLAGEVGGQVTIIGSNFGEADTASVVYFGLNAATFTSWSDTLITCEVPAGVSRGVPIKVGTGGGLSNEFWFAVLPHIEGISPSSGPVGTEVTITGTALDPAKVYIDSVEIDSNQYLHKSYDEIVFRLPATGAGEKEVRAAYELGSSNSVTFTVLPAPFISSIDPDAAMIGEEITIYGGNFGVEQGDSYVSFDDEQATEYVSWSDDSIVCKVSQVATGYALVTVTTSEGTSPVYSYTVNTSLQGRVTDAMSGEPIEGIYVCLFFYYTNPTNIAYFARTDPNGEYVLEDVYPADYRLGFHDATGTHQYEFFDEQLEFYDAEIVSVPVDRSLVIDEDMMPILSITSITPSSGVQNTVVNATINGSRFEPGITARLENVGAGVSIAATDVVFVSGNQITCRFNLSGLPLVKYDVVVLNPDGSEARLVNGFRVTDMCGQGSGAAVLMLGLAMGLLSLAGSTRLFRRKK